MEKKRTKKYKIYLDNCCFNRPYDNQSDRRIHIETEAKLFIQEMIKNKTYHLVWSYILDFENSANPDDEIKNRIFKWKNVSEINILENDAVVVRAKEYKNQGLGVKDSLHLSCAVEASSDFFITTDDGILSKKEKINNIKIVNPVDFIVIKGGIK